MTSLGFSERSCLKGIGWDGRRHLTSAPYTYPGVCRHTWTCTTTTQTRTQFWQCSAEQKLAAQVWDPEKLPHSTEDPLEPGVVLSVHLSSQKWNGRCKKQSFWKSGPVSLAYTVENNGPCLRRNTQGCPLISRHTPRPVHMHSRTEKIKKK